MRVKPTIAPLPSSAIVVDGALAATVPDTLAARLGECAARLGGKRALAKAAGLSEAQLFRYLNGDSEMSVGKAEAIARAAGVQLGWLLTGEGEAEKAAEAAPRAPALNPSILEDLTFAFEELLLEYQTPLTSRQRANAISFLYQALRHDEITQGYHTPIDRRMLMEVLEYYDHFKSSEMLESFRGSWEESLGGNSHAAGQFVEMAQRGTLLEYDGFSGRGYFNRVTAQVSPASARRLTMLMEEAARRFKAPRFLDMGTGNGRDLAFVRQHFPETVVAGLELSRRGVTLATQLEQAGRLPKGSVSQGTMLAMPYADGSFEVVNARAVISCLPYVPGTGVGTEAAFREVGRVLVKGGLFAFVTREGKGRVYVPFAQHLTREDVAALAEASGFRIAQVARHDPNAGMTASATRINQAAMRHEDFIEAVLQKI